MSLISKQDKELAIEALDFYASELILEGELLTSGADSELGYVSAGYDSNKNVIILNEINSSPAHETGEPQATQGSNVRTVLSNKIRSVQTLKNWIALDLAKSNLKG